MNAFKLFRKGPTNQIAAAVTYDAATDTATLNPTNNLKRGVIYKAVVSTLAKDVEGNRLDQDDSPLERENRQHLRAPLCMRRIRAYHRPLSFAFCSSPYSPECVEGEFSGLHIQDAA